MEVARRPGHAPVAVERRNAVSRLTGFYNEVIAEMRKVTWPDQPQLRDYTLKILVFVLFVAAVIGFVDLLVQLIFVRGIPSFFAR